MGSPLRAESLGEYNLVRKLGVGGMAEVFLASQKMQGGVVQGIGWALNEEYVLYEDGSMENPSFLDYRIPVACSDIDVFREVAVVDDGPDVREQLGAVTHECADDGVLIDGHAKGLHINIAAGRAIRTSGRKNN